jgi:hypothetical protein
MQLDLSKHNDNITSLIWWLNYCKHDVWTSSSIHPCIQLLYNIEDRIVFSSQKITYIPTDRSIAKLELSLFGKQLPPHVHMHIKHRPSKKAGYY